MKAINKKKLLHRKKKGAIIRMRDITPEFMEATGHTLADYSVALGYFQNEKEKNPTIFGSGVLVRKGNRLGILTAHHCVYSPGPNLEVGNFGGHRLALLVKRCHPVIAQSETFEKHALATPVRRTLEPDLAFLEIAPSPLLSSLKAIASFWPLDSKALRKARKVGKAGTLFTVIGFPGQYQLKIPATRLSPPRHLIKHMTFYYVIGARSVSRRMGWDYIEATNRFDQGNDLPESFEGVSGGPIWGLRISKDKKDGEVKLKGFSLIGIAFLQNRVSKTTLKIRGHFIDSIYKTAWQSEE